jgi:hypothetical protein
MTKHKIGVHRFTEEQIDAMAQLQMARLWRFEPSGFLQVGDPLSDRFTARFAKLGGFTPEISKAIGW